MLTRNIQRRGGQRRERPVGERYVVCNPFFLDSGRVLGGVEFKYVHTYYSLLIPIIHQYSSMDVTIYIENTGGAEYFLMLMTAASSLGILTTTASRIIRHKSMASANSGKYEGQHPCDGYVDTYN